MTLSSALGKDSRKAIDISNMLGKEEDEEAIHQKIDAIEDVIQKLKAKRLKLESKYISEMNNIRLLIKKKQIEKDTQLSKLRQENDNELKELDEMNEEEVRSIKIKIEETQESLNNFHYNRQALKNAKKEAELHELRQQLDTIKQMNQSIALESSMNLREKNMELVKKHAELLANVEIMKATIDEAHASIQQNLLYNTQLIRDTNYKYQCRAEENQKELEKMRKKLEIKTNETDELIKQEEEMRKQIIDKYNNELASAQDRERQLSELRVKLAQKHKYQRDSLKEEIESVKDAIEKIKEICEENEGISEKHENKISSIVRDNVKIDSQIEEAREEIQQMKSSNAILRKELQRLRSRNFETRMNTILPR